MNKAIPPTPAEEPPSSRTGMYLAGIFIAGAIAFWANGFNKAENDVNTNFARIDPSAVPQGGGPVSMIIPVRRCRQDWRACFDNRDWIESGDRGRARGACTAFVKAAGRYGGIALDPSWPGPRFGGYMSGGSIRRGSVVLVDPGGLVRDGTGRWFRTPLHCTFDLVSGRVSTVTLP